MCYSNIALGIQYIEWVQMQSPNKTHSQAVLTKYYGPGFDISISTTDAEDQ